jgi:DNA helicase HerA-like ATPase
MRFLLGHNAYLKRTQSRDIPVIWDSRTVINPHVLVVGGSGSGKTFTLRRMIEAMASSARPAARLHVFDVHGDIEVPAASSVKFSESTPYGQNPLAVDPDPDHGGVRRRIQSLIAALNRTSRQLGPRQEAVLRALLTDLYAANGFHEERPDSWRLNDGVARRYPKKHPTVQDAARFGAAKLRALYLGADARAVAALEQVNGKARTLYAKAKALGQIKHTLGQGPADASPADPDLEKAKDQAIEAYAAAVRAIGTGRELDDLIRYDSRDVLRSVVERLESLNASGIFRPEPPPFAPNAPVWRYDLRALAADEKKLFVYFRLEELFRQALQRGVQDQVVEIAVLDEAHLFFTDEVDNPLNVLAKEARKFGLALVCASQSPTHFSEDFLGNVATKIILGIDEMYWDGSVRKLKIEPKTLQYIMPKRTLAVQIKTGDGERARFIGVEIPAAAGTVRAAGGQGGGCRGGHS